MKRLRLLFSLAILVLMSFYLVACQSSDEEQAEETGEEPTEEEHDHEEDDHSHDEDQDHDEDHDHDHDHDEEEHSHDEEDHDHDHSHDHDEESQEIYDGYFEDSQVENRELSDWEGDWQSVYPYHESGELDEVFTHKAEEGDMTEEEYKEYYEVGYETDVDRIIIDEGHVTFFENEEEYSGEYTSDGYEILTYEAGNRGVRFIFELVEGSGEMPQYIQFSDHNIYPTDAHHYHLYWGDDREELLEEVTNWPTYYPSDLDAEGIVHEMIAH
ncbi:metal-binding protein ZinT [Halalkalibacillus halophilus]|uniref:metal-binding protein ZinT n=1 Tax=Halalkalibacillus halophilus TaxID=392827 RepID=UPI0004265232|nr:metal-binding protein ZinT [Halalkalibacillus halophilus]